MLPLWILWAAHSVVEVEDLYADQEDKTMHPWMVEAYMLGLKVVTGHIVLGEGSDCVSVDEIYDEGLTNDIYL